MPELSIIATTYNVAPYIDECLRGLISQTLHDIEIIVVDDGSSDATRDRIAHFATLDDRIRPLYLPENSIGGVATAANAGIDLATGEYIGFADGDDIYDPTMFEKLLAAARDHEADIAFCNYALLDERTGNLTDPPDERRWGLLGNHGALDLDEMGRKTLLPFIAVPWRKIYRKDLLGDEIRFPVGDYFYEDNPFHWFVVLSAEKAAFVQEKLCSHRVNRAGQTMSAADNRLFRIFDHHETIYEWLKSRGQVEIYKPALLAWVISQMDWIARKCPPDLRGELFTKLRDTIRPYSLQDAVDALDFKRAGLSGGRLTFAVFENNIGQFFSIADNTDEASLLEIILYKYKRHGISILYDFIKIYSKKKYFRIKQQI